MCNFCVLRWFLFLLIHEPASLCFAVVVLELCLDKATCMSLWGEKEMIQRESFADEGSGKEKASLWRAVTGFPQVANVIRSLCSIQAVNYRKRKTFRWALNENK